MTVEASLIIPAVIVSLIVLVYICFMLYEQSYIKALANTASERGAATWANPSKDMYMEFIDKRNLAGTSLYWRVGEFFTKGDKQKKYDKVNAFVLKSISKNSFFTKDRSDKGKETLTLKYTDSRMSVKCDLEDYVIYKKLKVSIEEEYSLPISNMFRAFGIDVKFKISASSESVVDDPVEFVRNTDFVMDSVREIDQKTGGKLEGAMEKVTGTFDKLSGKLKSFLE
ncbi:MAG TPA: hypothetical protein VIO64_18515 [Pseudobacteroides sp.]|uniref:hypothetical protein n=1 Tax=Pseudobacteroides sp. TaxID=1968840 RepID=UPI002F935437